MAELIIAISGLVTAVGIVLTAWWAYRAKERSAEAAERATEAAKEAKRAATAIVATKDGIYELGRRIDGRMDELLLSARESGHAAGVAQERSDTASP